MVVKTFPKTDISNSSVPVQFSLNSLLCSKSNTGDKYNDSSSQLPTAKTIKKKTKTIFVLNQSNTNRVPIFRWIQLNCNTFARCLNVRTSQQHNYTCWALLPFKSKYKISQGQSFSASHFHVDLIKWANKECFNIFCYWGRIILMIQVYLIYIIIRLNNTIFYSV